MRRLILFVLLGICIGAYAQEFTYEGIYYQILDQETKTCTTKIGSFFGGANQVGGEIVLPAHPIYNGEVYTLTEIGDHSFSGAGNRGIFLKSVSIPNTVERIGIWAFCLQEELTTINIPESVKIVDDYAFANCYSLSFVNIANGLKQLGHAVFRYDGKIQELVLPNSLETINGFLWGDKTDMNNPERYGLKKIICNSLYPPQIKDEQYNGYAEWVTEGIAKETILYVPKGSKENYLDAYGWKNYGADRIKELDEPMVFLDKNDVTMVRGERIDLEIIYAYDIFDRGSSASNIVMVSSDEKVATIEEGTNSIGRIMGIVTAIGNGNARLTITIKPVSSKLDPVSAYCDVTVKDGNVSFSLSDKTIELALNETKQLVVDLTGLEVGKSTLTVTLTNEKGEDISETCDINVVGTTSDVSDLFSDSEDVLVNIYNLNGVLLKSNVKPESVMDLPKGLYIVGDKKILVK